MGFLAEFYSFLSIHNYYKKQIFLQGWEWSFQERNDTKIVSLFHGSGYAAGQIFYLHYFNFSITLIQKVITYYYHPVSI